MDLPTQSAQSSSVVRPVYDEATLTFAQDGGGLPEPPAERVDAPEGTEGSLAEIVAIALAAGIFLSFIGLLCCMVIIAWDESDFGRVNRQTLAQVIKWLLVLLIVSSLGELVNVLFFWQPL